jgi:hypothetical protein
MGEEGDLVAEGPGGHQEGRLLAEELRRRLLEPVYFRVLA